MAGMSRDLGRDVPGFGGSPGEGIWKNLMQENFRMIFLP